VLQIFDQIDRLGDRHQFMNATDLVGFVQLVPLNPKNSVEHRNAN
jgi:hypothetical protein